MEKKIICFSISCGSIFFITMFICQFFFKIHPNAMDINKIYVYDTIFLMSYALIVCFFLIQYKNVNKFILYIVIPFFLGCIIYFFSSLYYYICYGSRITIDVHSFLFFYFAIGFWAVGVFSCLVDLVLSYIIQQKYPKKFK